MATSATIDIATYVSPAESKTKFQTDIKPHGSVNNFEHVFDSANKAYKPEKSTNTTSKNSVSQNTSQNNSKNASSTEKTDSQAQNTNTSTNEKVEDNTQPTNSEVTENTNGSGTTQTEITQTGAVQPEAAQTNTQETVPTEVILAETPIPVVPKVELKTDIKVPNITDETKLTEEPDGTKKPEVIDEKTPEAQVPAVTPQVVDNTQLYNQPIVLTNEFIEVLKTTKNVTDEDIARIAETLSKGKGTADSNIINQAPAQAQPLQQAEVQIQTPVAQTSTPAKTAEALAASQSKNSDSKIAPTTQPNPTPMPQTDTAETKMPVIQANTEIIASNVTTNTSNTKQSETEIVDKSKLSQDMIDKTNAKVVGIEKGSGNSSGSNLLNQQSPQEQGMKLALENNNKTTSTSTTENNDLGKIGNAGQITFAKTLDNIQAPAPKELSKTDILSQINNQLNTLKEETNTKITIILKPENLGKISLELTSGKDGLIAKMTTDNAQVKELLDKHLDSLKDTLGNQGVNVNNVTVKVSETHKQDNMFSFGDQKGQENQHTPENKQTNRNNGNNGNGLPLDEEIDTLAESTEPELKRETSISMNSRLGKIDYKI